MDVSECDQLREQLGALILSLAERIDSNEQRIASCEELLTKIITGFQSAATNQRKLQFGNELRAKYADRLNSVMPAYKKLVGLDRDPATDIAEAVFSARNSEGYDAAKEGEFIEGIVAQILDRFGLDSLRGLITPAGSVEVEISGPVKPETKIEELRNVKKRIPKIVL